MEIFELDPYIRFINVYPSLHTHKPFSIGYDCRIFVVLQGSIELKTEFATHTLTENDMVYIPAGEKYSIVPSDEYFFEALTINFDFTKKYAREIPNRLCAVTPTNFEPSKALSDTIFKDFSNVIVLKCDQTIINYFMLIYHESLAQSSYTKEKMSALFKYVILSVYDKNSMVYSISQNSFLTDITKYILKNYSDSELSNATLGKIFGYHPHYLNNLFKSSFGTTLHQYILNLRINAAKEFLRFSKMTISEISFQSGFNSSSYFSQKFKQITGLTPIEYRMSKRKS